MEKMAKKKRKTANEPDSKDQGEEEARDLSNAKLTHSADTFIIISDSDGEQESKEEHALQRKGTKQQLDRVKFTAKRKISLYSEMSEDEQFALALKMSEQEARQLNSQEEEEEELLRKAIAESLSSCQASAAAPVPLLSQASGSPVQSHPSEPEGSQLLAVSPPCSKSPCSDCSSLFPSDKIDENTETCVTKSPLVVLTRLSQDIVESSLISSIIVTPGKSQTFAMSGTSSPAGNCSSDTSHSSEELPAVLSPTFPQRPRRSWQLEPRRLFMGKCSLPTPTSKEIEHSQNYLKGNLHVDCPGVLQKEAQQQSTFDHDTSPSEFRDQAEHGKNTLLSAELTERTGLPESAPAICTLPRTDEKCQHEEPDVVHYYWGVPFCPKGIDPNKYTQVIMCQLEVYQKSLKQAQRQLLQKKPFGEPIVPNSCSLRQRLLAKDKETSRQREDTDDQEGEDMDEKKEPDNVPWLLSQVNGESYKHPAGDVAEGGDSECGDEPASSSLQASQVLFADDMPEEREPVQITQSICALTPLDNTKNPDIATEDHAEEEITVCPETQQSPSQAVESESGEIHSSSKNVFLQADEDVREHAPGHSPQADNLLSCPLCELRFPASKIELHAMNCNGTGEDAVEDGPVMTRRQREAKSKLASCKKVCKSVDIDKYEKCYLCKSLVLRKEYQSHVDSCLYSWSVGGTQGHRRPRHAKEKGRCEGGLLRMLEQSENKTADAEIAVPPSRREDSRPSSTEMDKETEGNQNSERFLPQVPCSDSPIKSFTSISEAKDCLVDFKKQLAIKPHAWKQTKASHRNQKKC
ncbi:BRCA1-A complex subunit RAP80 isoform X2 [Thamnophis elegans]|uniref:BRCA1-A complex subunit RAP80 isoform X1 n=4 Tax=Thamnophis elegans TaxID=35005 RepID=UPI0013774BC8|nr:BRCA1-A complex subunit RAP80 isoform X1 [Thamnophis elegans]XP_032065009.1 BRCA1-A complex subunit RAP80 isoform X2 [Thamnophis elegans]